MRERERETERERERERDRETEKRDPTTWVFNSGIAENLQCLWMISWVSQWKNQGAVAVMKDYHPPDKEIGKSVSKRSIERNPGVKSATPASIKISCFI